MNSLNEKQSNKAQQRWLERKLSRTRNIRLINEHRYFDADTPERVKKFLTRRGVSSTDTKEILKAPKGIPSLLETSQSSDRFLSLERTLGTNDLVNISFLQIGLEVAKTIGRIWICENGGRLVGYGTGFMVSPTLLMTNHHVLPDKTTAKYGKVEFRYELDVDNNLVTSEIFNLDPASFYISNEDLDFALVAVVPESSTKKPLDTFGWNKLSKEEGKTIISQFLNIVQHPNGMPKQIGLRENQLIDVLDDFLHYKTDTERGSSGSAVFNERWEVVALHHSGVWETNAEGKILAKGGGIWNQSMGDDEINWVANEGVRISSIFRFLESRKFNTVEARLFDEMCNAQPSRKPSSVQPESVRPSTHSSNGSQLNADGSVTWTFPLSVTVNVGNQTPVVVAQNRPTLNPPLPPVSSAASNSDNNEASILRKAKQEFLKRGDVINVRMGYVFKNGWITKDRAIVVTVAQRKTNHELNKEATSRLPEMFLEHPVEVTGPTFEDLIAYTHGQEKYETLVASHGVNADEIKYTPPSGAKLKKITDKMKITIHVSPEQGWKNLGPFLTSAKKSLTVAMYDFGSPHIVAAIEKAAKAPSFKRMTLTLQPGESVGEGTKKDDLKDQEVVDQLADSLDSKFENAWVRIGRVNGWVSSSYHIKVAVKDSKSFWLSSGNWQSSNQPDINNLDNKTQSFLLKNYNREWHAIVEHDGLAKTFEEFIQHDFENNKDNPPRRDEALLENLNFLIPESAFAIAEEAAIEYKPFPVFEKDDEITVTPLLTPDNYYEEVLDLINSAERQLLIQNQTFNAPKDGHEKLEELMNAVLKKQQDGVEVKIIFRVVISSVARENLEKLVDMGFDPDSIRIQKNCHTKGVIVDGKTVMLGSQNWSNDGISVNRDASLIFHDTEVAKYFKELFFHDWKNLAKSNVGRENLTLEIATDPKNIPPGMELISWSDVRETL